MSKQSGDEIFVVDGSLGDPSIKLGRRDTGFYVTRPGTYDANAPLRVATVVAGVLQGQADKFAAAPVDGVAATDTLTHSGVNVTAADSVTVAGKVYTFVTPIGTTEGNVLIGIDANTTMDNLILAINLGAGGGTKYVAAAAHPTVSAANRAGSATTLSAKTKGVAGNALALAKSAVTLTVGGPLFTGGIDGTVGSVGQIATDGTNLFICLAAATITDSGKWKKITIGVL